MTAGDWLKLSGILIVLVGLALRLRTTLVVVTAALVTGVAAGLPLFSNEGMLQGVPYLTAPVENGVVREGIINMLGRAFSEYRLMTLFIITLPAIGLAERYGLQEQSAALIRRIRAATVGRLQITYQLFRVLTGILGLRLNGHAAFVRPLVFPMSVGAAEAATRAASAGDLPEDKVERIKAANAAAENYGNFYGQNLSPVQAGVLLVFGVMDGLGYAVSVGSLVLYAIPVASISVVLGAIQFSLLDRLYQRKARNNK
jgi:uncharacterized membrane protein